MGGSDIELGEDNSMGDSGIEFVEDSCIVIIMVALVVCV